MARLPRGQGLDETAAFQHLRSIERLRLTSEPSRGHRPRRPLAAISTRLVVRAVAQKALILFIIAIVVVSCAAKEFEVRYFRSEHGEVAPWNQADPACQARAAQMVKGTSMRQAVSTLHTVYRSCMFEYGWIAREVPKE